MNLVAQIAALLAGLLHVVIFSFESLLFRRPTIHARFLVADNEVDTARPWAFNQGFYNLFLAVGTLGGLVMLYAGGEIPGRTLVLFCCGSMLAAAVVLVASEPKMARAAAMQGAFPLIALIASIF
jgi:putative membrane protein